MTIMGIDLEQASRGCVAITSGSTSDVPPRVMYGTGNTTLAAPEIVWHPRPDYGQWVCDDGTQRVGGEP